MTAFLLFWIGLLLSFRMTYAAPFSLQSAIDISTGNITWTLLAQGDRSISAFKNLRYLFVFGDSWTTSQFNISGTQPSSGNPLGNPPYPGLTSSKFGPNFVDYLTVKYNQSEVFTYNLASGGAMVDSELIKPFIPGALSFKDQIQKTFFGHCNSSASLPWTSANSQFLIFTGVNDISYLYGDAAKFASLTPQILQVLVDQLQQLYQSGARNFIIFNMPALDKCPATLYSGGSASTLEAGVIATFNTKLLSALNEFARTHPNVSFVPFDLNTLTSRALQAPQTWSQTANLKNTTGYCEAYRTGTREMDTFNSSCLYPVNEYFWLNEIHPTYPFHDLLAQQIAVTLGA